MIAVSVMYPNNEGATFDWGYYAATHLRLVRESLGSVLKGARVEKGVSGPAPGSPPQYVAIAQLMFESMDVFGAAFQAHGQALMADIPNFTNVQPLIQISEIAVDN